RAARDTEKMLVVVFCDPRHTDIYDEYLDSLAVNKAFRKSADNIVLCRLPLDYKVKLTPTAEQEAAAAAADKDAEHKEIKLITHSAFAEMHQRPGFVFIDYVHTKSKYYGRVVNIYPFKGRFLSASQLLVMMDLPEGSLTQRTMIFAVRTHPEAPASTRGSFISELAEETESHSQHQANIRVQGHHQWDSRFHRINSRLGRGLLAREVVAESWPGQDLVDAAEEAVHSWRQSPGHWSAVRSSHPVFAFDIKRGLNGIWYATGIFGNR
ncbi:MAG TPA: hypothetical protein VL096_07645, partial [Pirellulaceae bacterium]|nr:hypothetical protein [Pirellulaceae bacterium]